MNCPNCNNEIYNGNICSNCGVDVVLFKQTVKISDVLYNKGLSLSKIRDLSGAEDALIKSVQFNKNNYYARNLLGLIYYEIGRISEALKQWIISSSLVSEQNPAVKYIEEFKKDPKHLDKLDDAIRLYNSALGYISQKNDDMAVIQLQSAIEQSPNFVDAMNLLTFCYLIQNEKQKATIFVNKVLVIDVNNPIALNYYSEIYPNRAKPKPAVKTEVKSQTKGQATTMLTPENRKRLFESNFYFAEIISFIVGSLCTLALMYTLVFPGATNQKDNRITELESKMVEIEDNQKKTEIENNRKIAELQEKNTKLLEENTKLSSVASSQDRTDKISQAGTLINEGSYNEAASMLYAIDITSLEGVELENYENYKAQSFVKAALNYYNEGERTFGSGNYEESKHAFEAYFIYASPNGDLADDATYFLGRIAEIEGDYENAKIYYNKIINDYAGSNREEAATSKLIELN